MPSDMPAQPRFTFAWSRRQGLLVLNVGADDPHPHVLCRGVPDVPRLAELHRALGQPFTLERCNEAAFEAALGRHFEQRAGDDAAETAKGLTLELDERLELGQVQAQLLEPADLMESQDDAPVIRLINALLADAIRQSASDIHLETFEQGMTVRIRVDGMLRVVMRPHRALAPLLVSRLKVMAELDIAERRLPQDGRIAVRLAGRAVDVRVSTLPTGHGERVVLRLLDKHAGHLALEQLGMPAPAYRRLAGMVQQPHGIVLVTGPTGSGKTTTLYAALNHINAAQRNIMTVEDPIEYELEGISQTQVNSRVEMTFARGLRAILRQDPDVVMIGEIRDLETAQIAVQASLTGHLVLATLHTNTALGAVTRLRDMGVAPYLLASSLLGVVAQRLVRQLCRSCRQAYTASAAECRLLGLAPAVTPPSLYHARGCSACHHSGYRGRAGLYDAVALDATLRDGIHDRHAEAELEAHARRHLPSLMDDGRRRVLAGDTTLEEVLRVTRLADTLEEEAPTDARV